MLGQNELLNLLDRLGTPVEGRKLIASARKYAPVRDVVSRGGNIITYYHSRKMQRQIGTESRHLEFSAAIGYEHDPDTLEYYPQPCRLKIEIIDDQGEIHSIDHTPDFLVIKDGGIVIEEWKSWEKLDGLARRYPWRYQLGPDDNWYSQGIEQWLADRGIIYRIRTDRDISPRRVDNISLLEDYLHPSAPPCPIDVEKRIHVALVENAVLYLAELYETADCRPDDLLKLIADGLLVADMDVASLSEPNRCQVFRDTAVRDFEHARNAPIPFPLPGVVDIRVGARLKYNHIPYTITILGSSLVVLTADDDACTEISLGTLEELAVTGVVAMEGEANCGTNQVALSAFTEDELRAALVRQRALENDVLPGRTQRRLEQMVAQARIHGTDELLALMPRTRYRGNRVSRLSPFQEDLIAKVIREEHLTSRAPNKKSCYQKLVVLCAEAGIKAPSYPTLIARTKALPQHQSDRARHGKRVAYQNSEFAPILKVDTPVHGSRPFQGVHMDHTLLDIELLCSRTGKPLGRPWLSLAVDAFTRKILGFYLSFNPPSYRSNAMLLRDIVRRHRRLPQMIVVDNGADFRSREFLLFAELMGVHVRFRPPGEPRPGAVLERLFGHLNTAYIHNLAGNTKATKNVRQTTGKFLPSRLAEWSLEALYYGVEYWAFNFYDQNTHPALNLSPREAFERGMALAGERAHRIVTLNQDFLIMTCPLVERQGLRKVDRQRGVKVHDRFYYWCPEFANPAIAGTKVPVRYDPWDASTVFVQVNKRWVPARCKALAALGQMTEPEREAISDEYAARHPHSQTDELTTQRLSEFMRTFTPKGALELKLLRQQEDRLLQQQLGLGAVSRDCAPWMLDDARDVTPVPTVAVSSSHTIIQDAPLTAESAIAGLPSAVSDDLPDFDTF